MSPPNGFHVESPPAPDLCRKLMLDYPFKGYQFRQLGLTPERMVEHHIRRLGAPSAHAVALREGDRSGLFSGTTDTYLQGHLGMPASRIDNFLRSGYRDVELATAMIDYYRDHSMARGFSEAWIPLEDVVGIAALQHAGFYQVGVEMRLARRLDQGWTADYPAGIDIRPYRLEFEDRLRDLCSRFHETNRFGLDPRIDPDLRSTIYVTELSSLLKAPHIRCFTFWDGDRLLGFNTAKINQRLTEVMGEGYGSLDLIVLHPEGRRRGAGLALSLATLEWLRDQGIRFVGSRTMASNYPAIALLHHLEFKIVFAKTILHRWADRGTLIEECAPLRS